MSALLPITPKNQNESILPRTEQVDRYILSKLEEKFGEKVPVSSILDQRVTTLRSVFIFGRRIALPPAEEFLGNFYYYYLFLF